MVHVNKLPIKSVMHPLPHTVGTHQHCDVALHMMTEHKCRHLPVQEAGKLVGILSDRDINFALRMDRVSPAELLVRDAYTPEPYVVPPETPVYQVASKMAHDHIGCALVIENEKLIGIFTTVDACRLLSEVLAGRAEQ